LTKYIWILKSSLYIHSYIHYKFFILFFDNCTSYGWIVLLRHKSKADPAISQFIAMVKNQFNKVIHEFMIDTGGEFKSNKLRMFLKELGINILTSVLHMHQQNGHAERFIQTIVEKAQAICLEACLPQNWWEFAVNYAVHVYNCTSLKHSSNDYKTLFERLHCTKPDVAHLRVFGCRAYVFLPEDVQSNNLSLRSELMTFIGLSEGTKGYIFMRSPNNNVFTTIQALFDETLFPKCPTMRWLGYTPVGLPPDDLQGEHNRPPDDENGEYGGVLPPIPMGPAGGQAPWQPMQPQQPPMFPPAYPPLPPSQPFSCSSSHLSYKDPSPQMFSRDPTPPRYQTDPPEERAPSPWRDTHVLPPPMRLRQPWDDWTPYARWFYNHATQEDNDLKLRDPDIFWLDELIGDQNLSPEQHRLCREQMGIPPIPSHCRLAAEQAPWRPTRDERGEELPYIPDPQPQPQEGLSGSQSKCSSRERRPVVHPDNVYGSRNPTQSEQMSNREFRKIIDDVPEPSGSGNRPDSPLHEGKGKEHVDYLVKIVQEGGASLIKFLLRATVSSTDAKGKIPKVSKV
jgi:hypothetical protein